MTRHANQRNDLPYACYPVVYFDETGRVLFADAITRRLFAPWQRGKAFLEHLAKTHAAPYAATLRFGGVSYFFLLCASSVPSAAKEMHLTRDLFPAFRAVTLQLLKRQERLLGEGEKGEEKAVLSKRGASLAEALCRREFGGTDRSCDVEGFLAALSSALSAGKLEFSYACRAGLCAYGEPNMLRFLVCTLLQFTALLSKDGTLRCRAVPAGKRVCLAFYFHDGGRAFRLLEESFSARESEEELLLLPPFLGSVIRILKENFGLKLSRDAQDTVLCLELPRADALPTAFLGKTREGDTLAFRLLLRRLGLDDEKS